MGWSPYRRQRGQDGKHTRQHHRLRHTQGLAREVERRQAVRTQLLERDATEVLNHWLGQHCRCQLLSPIATDVVSSGRQAPQRGISSNCWSKCPCTLWTKIVEAQIELRTGERQGWAQA